MILEFTGHTDQTLPKQCLKRQKKQWKKRPITSTSCPLTPPRFHFQNKTFDMIFHTITQPWIQFLFESAWKIKTHSRSWGQASLNQFFKPKTNMFFSRACFPKPWIILIFTDQFCVNTHTQTLAFPVCHSSVLCAKANRIKRESGELYKEV